MLDLSFYALPTPVTDRLLQVSKLYTKEGTLLNDSITKGQRIIMECILTRKSPDVRELNRIQVDCLTRYGKSMTVGAAVAMSASYHNQSWTIIAPTQDKAQIIIDEAIRFATSDPVMRANLIIETKEFDKIDKLKEHKAKNHITFKRGGEIRALSAGQGSSSNEKSGNTLMGFGSKNIIEDEAYLIDDNTHSKVQRMLGDNPFDNFLMKIGNPFFRNHAYDSRNSSEYFTIIIDYKLALIEKRISPQLIEEMKSKPNFSVLYECIPPEEDSQDKDGYRQLIPESLLEKSMIKKDSLKGFGLRRDGVDISDGGDNYSVIVSRFENLAEVTFSQTGIKALAFATPIAMNCEKAHHIFLDYTGIGVGTGQFLERDERIANKLTNVSVGDKFDKSTYEGQIDSQTYFNLRAKNFWKLKLWLESGGKLVEHPKWKEMLNVKYKINQHGLIQIMPKEEMRKRGIQSPDHADALALTFSPEAPSVSNEQGGGINF